MWYIIKHSETSLTQSWTKTISLYYNNVLCYGVWTCNSFSIRGVIVLTNFVLNGFYCIANAINIYFYELYFAIKRFWNSFPVTYTSKCAWWDQVKNMPVLVWHFTDEISLIQIYWSLTLFRKAGKAQYSDNYVKSPLEISSKLKIS